MFKSLSGLAGLSGMMQQAQQVGEQMKTMQEELRNARVKGSAGGGLIEAICTGHGELVSVTIDPKLITDGDKDLIEELIPQAVREAQAKGKELHQEMMQSVTSGFNVPGLDQALSQFGQ
ncbi:YbaB/EbfC family nucleoid-associated protein [Bremerella sp. JC817]|uniref:YbaB/EbfC family nucleoid-associated protein n=1 Tax=Bremerella sp. JC817 TaxID=3231756 RepID=UPI00345A8A46